MYVEYVRLRLRLGVLKDGGGGGGGDAYAFWTNDYFAA